MTEAVANILKQVEHLSSEERELLKEQLFQVLSNDEEISEERLAEYNRREAQIDSGVVKPLSAQDFLVTLTQPVARTASR